MLCGSSNKSNIFNIKSRLDSCNTEFTCAQSIYNPYSIGLGVQYRTYWIISHWWGLSLYNVWLTVFQNVWIQQDRFAKEGGGSIRWERFIPNLKNNNRQRYEMLLVQFKRNFSSVLAFRRTRSLIFVFFVIEEIWKGSLLHNSTWSIIFQEEKQF